MGMNGWWSVRIVKANKRLNNKEHHAQCFTTEWRMMEPLVWAGRGEVSGEQVNKRWCTCLSNASVSGVDGDLILKWLGGKGGGVDLKERSQREDWRAVFICAIKIWSATFYACIYLSSGLLLTRTPKIFHNINVWNTRFLKISLFAPVIRPCLLSIQLSSPLLFIYFWNCWFRASPWTTL